jgi:hypothetical protein
MILIPVFTLSVAGYTPSVPASGVQDARATAEPLIRAAVYENALAVMTGDIKVYRSHIAHRTLELYRLVFEGFKEVPDYAAMLSENKLDTAEKFIDATFAQGATQWAKLSKDEMAQRARAQSNGKLTFLNDEEAVLEFGGGTVRIIYEDKAWKIDETEPAKKLFLDNFQLTPATRAKIEKL